MDEELKEATEVETIETVTEPSEEVTEEVKPETLTRDPRIDEIIEKLSALEQAINEIIIPVRNMTQRDIPPAATSEQARPARRYI